MCKNVTITKPISSCALMSDAGTEKIWTLPLHEAEKISGTQASVPHTHSTLHTNSFWFGKGTTIN
jgi:hypothetical protein